MRWSKFVRNVYEMAMCSDNAAAIGFSDDGLCLEVRDPKVLSEAILQKYFKHKNVSSFIRQLNNYGFKTIPVLMSSSIIHCFAHDNFRRGRLDLLEGVMRRGNVTDEAHKMGEKLESLKQRELDLDQRLTQLKRVNDQLSRQNCDLAEENKRLRSGWPVMQDALIRCPPSQQPQQSQQQQQHLQDYNRGGHRMHSGGGPNSEGHPQQQQQHQNGYLQQSDYATSVAEIMPFPAFSLFSDDM
jgi:hypothetical protein